MKKALNRVGKKMNLVFALLIVLLIAAVVLLNAVALVLANRYPLSLDLTANAAYEIGSDTKTILAGLSDDVTIDVLSDENAFSQDAYLMQAKRILDQYPRYSERVKLRYIDYAADPSYAASHPDLTLADSDVIVSANGRVKQVALTSLFNYAYTATGSITIESSRAEEAVTGAIQYVLSGESVQIGVLSGNGEQSVENFTSLLVNNNYTLKSAVPATDDLSVYDALLLIAPQTDLSEDDIRALEAYLYNGGSYGKTLFYTASVTQTELPNIETFLAEWGVAFGDGVVFETRQNLSIPAVLPCGRLCFRNVQKDADRCFCTDADAAFKAHADSVYIARRAVHGNAAELCGNRRRASARCRRVLYRCGCNDVGPDAGHGTCKSQGRGKRYGFKAVEYCGFGLDRHAG